MLYAGDFIQTRKKDLPHNSNVNICSCLDCVDRCCATVAADFVDGVDEEVVSSRSHHSE